MLKWLLNGLLGHTSFVVAVVMTYLWLRGRHLPRTSIADMPVNPEKAVFFEDAVKGLTILGIKSSDARRRIRNVMKKHPEATDLSEVVKLAFDTED